MEASMVERHGPGIDPDKREEAVNLAREAAEELQHGHREEGKFLAEEARALDTAAADAVLKQPDSGQSGTAKPRRTASAKSGGSKKSRSAGTASAGSKAHAGGHAAERTTDHDKIRAWVEARNGHPSVVKRSHDTAEGGGILRLDFNEPEASLEEVPWDEFFETFEDRKLAFLYQDRTADGELSRFFKFVRRDETDR
jgi:hypothetical protein